MPEIVWKRGPEDDLLRIHAQLEVTRPGAGDRFTLKLDSVLDHLRRHPAIAPIFDPPMRRLVVRCTGYGLFSTVKARGIIVHALLHLSRDPAGIRDKVRRRLGLE